jgi:2-deoxy-D-gluconate 3-dehydrogenase
MILDQFRLDGKVAMVTGASSVLGQSICRGLAEAGADIIGVDYVEMNETKVEVETSGKKFLGVVANLLNIEPIQGSSKPEYENDLLLLTSACQAIHQTKPWR